MGDHTAVQKLIEILTAFYSEDRPLEEDLNFCITSEFLHNLRGVLFTKQIVAQYRWRNCLETFFQKMQPTPEMYLRHVIYACRQCSRIYGNIFERFLGVYAIILHFRILKFGKPEVDFSDLISDTFMGLYEYELKKPFRKFGGFRQFVEYINDPKYLVSNLSSQKDAESFNQKAAKGEIYDLSKQAMKVYSKEKQLPENFRLENAQNDWTCVNLAQKILKKSKVGLPSSPSNAGLESKLPQQLKKQAADKKTDIEAKEMRSRVHSILSDALKPHSSVLLKQMLEQSADEKKAIEEKETCFQLPSLSNYVMKTNLPVLPQQMLGQLTDKKAEAKEKCFQLPTFPREDVNKKLPVLPQQMLLKTVDEKKAFEAKGMRSQLPLLPSYVIRAKLPVLPQQMLGQLADKVLQACNRNLEQPSYFSDTDVKGKLREQVAEKAMDLKVSTETNVIVEQMKDNTQLENIIQAVIRHNRSISSDQAKQNNHLQQEACEILEQLKDKIETLIELLGEYDKE